MKIRFLLFALLLIIGLFVKGQQPSVFLKLTNKNITFSQNLPIGSYIIDVETFKQYVTLKTLPSGAAVSIASCEKLLLNSSNVSTAHLREINVNGAAHHIGDLYLGGIIVAVWNEGGVEKGLIASKKDVIVGRARWNSNNTADYPLAINEIDGLINKANVVTTSAISNAMYLAQNFDGASGWYLPAKWELSACFSAAPIVNQILNNDAEPINTKGFQTDNPYWTSTQASNIEAWAVSFDDGNISRNSKASNQYYVRAVKRF